VKNPNKQEKTDLRDPKDIIEEIAKFNLENEKILKNIKKLI
jgi:hypothetical protein